MTTVARQPPIRYIDRTRAQYSALGHGIYHWAHNPDPPPWVEVTKPISESRLGLVATGGIYAIGQTAFTHRDDTTYRAIAADTASDDLRVTHFAYDLTDARRDINVVFPIDTLRSLEAESRIGSLADTFYTCMGGIYSQRRVNDELAPALLERCRADEVDLVLLVPV
ncbi:MAG: glycine/sarcosine/betaine reductase selenoprotein B family protein [Acidimicrobiales bacterium]